MLNIRHYIKEFEYYMSIEKNYSAKTIKTYKNGLNDFVRYLEEKEGIKDVSLEILSRDHAKKYIIHIKNEAAKGPNKPTTINLKISVLKSFYNYLVQKKHVRMEDNITMELRQQKIPKILPIYLTCEEAENFLLGIKLLSRNAKRDYAIFSLFLLTGARLSEITNLKLDQINFKDASITLYGKGSKERTVPMVERAENALLEYLESEKTYIVKSKGKGKSLVVEDMTARCRAPRIDTNVVFLNKYGKPLTERGVQDIFKGLVKKIGIQKKGLSVHKLRHTCFTLLFRAGVDIITIKNIAGHENIRTTEIYTHIANNDLRRHMNLNPLCNRGYDDKLIRRIKENYNKE